MLSIATARALAEAGLVWQPAQLDCFVIPDHGLDDRIFVISEMPAGFAQLNGQPVVTFEGAVEWALDYVATGEVLWLPTEAQLREMLTARLAGDPQASLTLRTTAAGCRCDVQLQGSALSFEAANGSEAYAGALLQWLRSSAGQ